MAERNHHQVNRLTRTVKRIPLGRWKMIPEGDMNLGMKGTGNNDCIRDYVGCSLLFKCLEKVINHFNKNNNHVGWDLYPM